MKKKNQNYSKHEPKAKKEVERVIEETDSVQAVGVFVITVNGLLWVKSQFPYVTTEYKSEASIMNFKKAVAWREQIKMRRRVNAEIVQA